VRKSRNLRKRPLNDLFSATDSSTAWITPSMIAIALIGFVAATALALSLLQLVDSEDGVRTVTASVTGGVLRSTVTVTVKEPASGPTRSPVREPRARLARLAVTAARGDCWLEARAGSRAGRVLFAGLLDEGRSLRLVERRLWLAFGAGGNLDVTLNGKRVESFPTGTAAVTITAQGVGPPAAVSSPAGS
jgi:hypothetical protein